MKSQLILVPTDLSRLGNRAFGLAEQYRRLYNGVILPVHAIHQPVWPEGIRLPSIDDKNSRELIRMASRRCTEEAEKWTPPEFIDEPFITYGDPVQVIREKAAEAGMVIMSTHGRTGFSKFMLGSVAGKVCRISKTPVMVTNPKDEISGFDKILLTTDFSEASFRAFSEAEFFLSHSDAGVVLLHVVSLEYAGSGADRELLKREAEERLTKIAETHFSAYNGRITTKVIVSEETVHRAIILHLDDSDYNLLIMSTTGRTGLNYALMGSTASQVIQLARVPVLTVRPDAPLNH